MLDNKALIFSSLFRDVSYIKTHLKNNFNSFHNIIVEIILRETVAKMCILVSFETYLCNVHRGFSEVICKNLLAIIFHF